MPGRRLRVKVKNLKKGDRFSFIPAAWYGPGKIRRSGLSDPHWRLEFDNAKVVNPPGLWYGDPSTVVMRLGRGRKKKKP